MENSKLLQLLLILLILISAGAAFSGQEEYSLAEIIDLYKQKNIALKIHRIEIDNAISRKKIARTWENPVVQYYQEGINTGTREKLISGTELQLKLEKKISFSGKKGLQIKHAQSNVNIASDEFQQVYWMGLSHAKILYYEIQFLTKNLEILKNTRQKLDEIREIIAENYKQGEASAIDTSRIGIVLKDTEVEKYNVEKILDQKKRELLTLLDLPQDQNHINFVEPYGQYKIQEEKKSLRDSMIEHNPLLRRLLNSYKREGIQLSLEKRKNIPDITAAGGYKKEDTFDTYSFSLSFNLPIFNQRKGEIEIAKNNLRMNKLQQRLFKKELAEAFENEYSKYSKTDVLIQLFKSQYLNQADKLEDTTLAAYKGGEVNILFLVDALHSAHKTRIEFIDLILQNNISIFSIEKLVGTELNVEKM